MRRMFLTLVILTFAPISAQAQLDHPDLLDIASWFSAVDPKSADENEVYIYQNESGNWASGSVDNSDVSDDIWIFWDLYEPDTVKRSHKRGRLDQHSYVQFGVGTWESGTGTWEGTTLENCKAWTVTSGTDGAATSAKWKASCKGVLAALGLPQVWLDRLADRLSGYVNVNSDKIGISGKGPLAP